MSLFCISWRIFTLKLENESTRTEQIHIVVVLVDSYTEHYLRFFSNNLYRILFFITLVFFSWTIYNRFLIVVFLRIVSLILQFFRILILNILKYDIPFNFLSYLSLSKFIFFNYVFSFAQIYTIVYWKSS